MLRAIFELPPASTATTSCSLMMKVTFPSTYGRSGSAREAT
ncbi:MAG TPA: hypothetical protein VEO54_14375 [Thermoanaerobaculia bacterium]|nr:hypothetical protein [Thermoanaerobaculia bacterium]